MSSAAGPCTGAGEELAMTPIHPATVGATTGKGVADARPPEVIRMTGALHAGINLLEYPDCFAVGLPYRLGLMLILGAHELGRYLSTGRTSGNR